MSPDWPAHTRWSGLNVSALTVSPAEKSSLKAVNGTQVALPQRDDVTRSARYEENCCMCWLRTDRLSAEDLGGIRFIGLDILEVAVQTNRRDFPGLEFEKYDLSRDPLPRRVDLVLCFDVLIHQTSHEQFTQCLNHLLDGIARHALVSYKNPCSLHPLAAVAVEHHDDEQHESGPEGRWPAEAVLENATCRRAGHSQYEDEPQDDEEFESDTMLVPART